MTRLDDQSGHAFVFLSSWTAQFLAAGAEERIGTECGHATLPEATAAGPYPVGNQW